MQIHLTRKELFHLVSHFAETEGTIFLYSGDQGLSYLALNPLETVHIQGGEDPWKEVEAALPPLSGGDLPEWLGFFNYEMGAYSDPERKVHTLFPAEAYLQRSSILLTFDPASLCAKIWFDPKAETGALRDQAEWKRLSQTMKPFSFSPIGPGPCIPLESKEQYLEKIATIREKIAAGEVYQVNLSQAFHVENFTASFPFFCKLMDINPVPFAAYLHLKGKTIICASPERLLSHRTNILEANPIKGTTSRGATFTEDERHMRDLLNSEKNRAELLMIVDLVRNDLGKMALPGTVVTPQLCELKTYPHLHHTQATIRAQALPHLSPLNLLRTFFPGGSISGCPKLRALQLISDLEKRARKSYTGAIGYFCGNGEFDWNIAIRTIEVEEEKALVQLGGAIVSDSDPEEEYRETLLKGKPIFQAMGVV